jgi:hypothetical protein
MTSYKLVLNTSYTVNEAASALCVSDTLLIYRSLITSHSLFTFLPDTVQLQNGASKFVVEIKAWLD